MLKGKYQTFYNAIVSSIEKKRILTDELNLLAYGTDASFYRLIPKIVVIVENETEVSILLKKSKELALSVTFRAAGTSLSGQSITDSILIVLGTGWKNFKINDDASKISLEPGIIGARANYYLAKHGKKIGPDPASINAAKIGGIAANNASGMCCGTAQNSYNTLSSMRIIFNDGVLLNTADSESWKNFQETHSKLVDQINILIEATKQNETLAERINHKFKMKNTTGYSLNALVDFNDPLEVIQHLMIGSEGTLGFISEITYNTVPELADKASSLMLFPNIEVACKTVEILKMCPVDAVELMDRASLRSVENLKGMPEYLKELDDDVAALLVETRGIDKESLNKQISEITSALTDLPKVRDIEFTSLPSEFAKLWNIRKGLFPSVGAMRKTGTTCIIEDVAFPIPALAEATLELQGLLKKHDYKDAIIFGHALEGNLHFVFNQDLNTEGELNRYKLFIDDLTEMVVVKYGGALKAEHGTGRNMAPFVEMEWGTDAYVLMKKIKDIFDPQNLLNPGVIINLDKEAHLKNLKPLPAAKEVIDKCIECGFCETHCPSKDLTLTPRHRIAVFREIMRLKENWTKKESKRLKELEKNFKYYGEETCATDGLCSLGCPVKIDTGKLVKELRYESNSSFANKVADTIANNFGLTISLASRALNAVSAIHTVAGTPLMKSITSGIHNISGGRIPKWNEYMPKGAKKIKLFRNNEDNSKKVVYFPSCIVRAMGTSKDQKNEIELSEKMVSLIKKAKFQIIYPNKLDRLCCGMAFNSKGFIETGKTKAIELEEELTKASENGKYPIVCDTSPCLLRMKETFNTRIELLEPVEFILDYLKPQFEFNKINEVVAIHSTCSTTKMGLDSRLEELANLCVEKVVIPDDVGCCGWAGDRGFFKPELNKSALKELKPQLIEKGCSSGYSTSRTCEIGLSLNSGITYKSILYLVDRVTTYKKNDELL